VNPYTVISDFLLIGTAMWVLFAGKYWIADYLLQSEWMVQNKAKLFHLSGWSHAFVHALCALPIWIMLWWAEPFPFELGALLKWTLILFGAEVLIRFLNDWAEANLVRLVPEETYARWVVIGLNKMVDEWATVGLCVLWWWVVLHEWPTVPIRTVGIAFSVLPV
jgi:hypothetical protein